MERQHQQLDVFPDGLELETDVPDRTPQRFGGQPVLDVDEDQESRQANEKHTADQWKVKSQDAPTSSEAPSPQDQAIIGEEDERQHGGDFLGGEAEDQRDERERDPAGPTAHETLSHEQKGEQKEGPCQDIAPPADVPHSLGHHWMNGEQRGCDERDQTRRAGGDAPCSIHRGSAVSDDAREQREDEDDVQGVEPHVRQAKSRRVQAPERVVDGKGQVDERTKAIEQQDDMHVAQMTDRYVVDNSEAVVVDERIAQGAQIEARRERSERDTGERLPDTGTWPVSPRLRRGAHHGNGRLNV